MKIEYKIWLTITLFAFVTIASILVVTHFLYQKLYVDRQIETLQMHGHALAETYAVNRASFHEQVRWSNESLEWEIIFTDNPMLLSGNLPFDMPLKENLISFEERQTLLSGQDLVFIRPHEKFNQDILAVVIPLREQGQLKGAIFLYTPLSAVSELFRPIMLQMIVLSFFLLLILIYAGQKVSGHIVKPLNQMTKAAERMAAGDFSERLSISQQDELGQLALTLNRMAQALQQVELKRREFLANVSHELRTPISYMKGVSEGVEEGVITVDHYIAVMKKESGRLERLVHDLLDLAQLEGDSYPMNVTMIPFSQLIMDVVQRFERSLENKRLTVQTDLDESLIVHGDPDRLEQVFTNILQNAIQYSHADEKIDVRLFAERNEAVVQIEDAGEGIPDEDITYVFDRFYRVNKARTRKDGGTGLGLAIAQQIVKKHNGDIAIQSKLGEGTTVTVRIPIESF